MVWNDIRPELVPLVEAKRERGEIDFVSGNILELKTRDVGPIDAVLATEVIEHCAHPDEFLAHLAGFLNPGGAIVLTTPLGTYCRNNLPRFSDCADPAQFEARQFLPDSDGHIFLLHLDEVQTLAQSAGLHVAKLTTLITPLTAGHIKLGWVLPLLPAGVVRGMEGVSRSLPIWIRRWLHSCILAVLVRP